MTSDITIDRATAWPGVVTVPRSALRARLAELLFRQAVRSLPVRVLLPDGSLLGAGGADAPAMRLVRPADFYHRLGVDGKIGFGESYMAGDWSSDELADVLTPFAARMATLVPPKLQRLRGWVDRRRLDAERNDLAGARSNIGRHYDLSNELFAAFLDETMTYSAAWFEHESQSLYDAQLRKIDGVLDYAGVREGSKVLEIGTGWGALAIRAAQRGAHVTSVTISAEQRELAESQIAAAGMSDRATVLLCGYRQVTGSYDAIVSVEMLEAVGLEYWPTFFAAVDRLLRPGGRIGLQVITMPHDRMLATRESYTWIHKYVFPGGMLPSVRAIEDAVAVYTRLRITERRTLGLDYARTLRLWRERFLDNWEEIRRDGFDETFRRMWEFYLAYSEAGFRSSYLDDWQFSMRKPAS
ncbi:MAG: methyltransferase domain-containing protein [Actinophytocola sp.]|nr:methyltransferase domain-containing protein [Actinophytocola sp.]